MELTVIELDTAEIVFFSQFDESAFFEWLNKISPDYVPSSAL